MDYINLCGNKISKLGFGAARLPEFDGTLDETTIDMMIDKAISGGVNFFSLSPLAQGGKSAQSVSVYLKANYDGKYYLANKYPGFILKDKYEPELYLNRQLDECNVNCFDYYMLENVWENSIETYISSDIGIVEAFTTAKADGKIKHLGFTCPGSIEVLERFLDKYGDVMEFCQIPINYYNYKDGAAAKLQLLIDRNIEVIAGSPTASGLLCHMNEYNDKLFKKLRPWETNASWALSFLKEIKGIKAIVPNVSSIGDVNDNNHIFNFNMSLQSSEVNYLVDLGVKMHADDAK